MAKAKAVTKPKGLYLNGSIWWMRTGGRKRSTGTPRLEVAVRVLNAIRTLEREPSNRDVIASARLGKITLTQLYDAHVTHAIDALRGQIAHAGIDDTDLEPLVEKWSEQMAGRGMDRRTYNDYVRLTRALVPAATPFRVSSFTAARVEKFVLGLSVTGSTKRRYISALRLFYKFARRRVDNLPDPFAFAGDWAIKNNKSRTTFWSHDTARRVVDRMHGEPRRMAALALGSGIELGALLALQERHIIDATKIVAPGTKTQARRDRTIFVDAWASAIAFADRTPGLPLAPIFTTTGKELRDAFYRAQLGAGTIAAPERSPKTRKLLWGQVVGVHHVHDARHTYALTRLLGTDGEAPRSMKFVAHQLGHADESQLMKVYARAGVEQRHELALEEIAADTRRIGIVRTGTP